MTWDEALKNMEFQLPDKITPASEFAQTSIAISLKRIADILERTAAKPIVNHGLSADDLHTLSKR